MEFILVVETNHKENEEFLHYCQWTGNEEELKKLFTLFEKADYETLLGGDYSSFWFSTITISESAVDEHVKIKDFGSYCHMFQKHTGKFVCPDFDTEDEFDIAVRLDKYFYGCNIDGFFKK